jgi:hypothetical protein
MAVLWVVGLLIALMMEAASTSETLVNCYQTIRRIKTEDSYLHDHEWRIRIWKKAAAVNFMLKQCHASEETTKTMKNHRQENQ